MPKLCLSVSLTYWHECCQMTLARLGDLHFFAILKIIRFSNALISDQQFSPPAATIISFKDSNSHCESVPNSAMVLEPVRTVLGRAATGRADARWRWGATSTGSSGVRTGDPLGGQPMMDGTVRRSPNRRWGGCSHAVILCRRTAVVVGDAFRSATCASIGGRGCSLWAVRARPHWSGGLLVGPAAVIRPSRQRDRAVTGFRVGCRRALRAEFLLLGERTRARRATRAPNARARVALL